MQLYEPVTLEEIDRPRLLRVVVGLPASGKTTRTIQWVREEPWGRYRCGLDDLRAMQGYRDVTDAGEGQERVVDAAREGQIRWLLRKGVHVAIDTTNLQVGLMERWERIAAACRATVEVDDLRHVPVEECIRRDRARRARGERYVGDDVIEAMAERAKEAGLLP